MKNIYYPTEESIKDFKGKCNTLVENNKISFSINYNNEYTKFTSNKNFGNNLTKIIDDGFDYLVLNPKNDSGRVHIDIAAKGDVYDSYTIIKSNKKRGYKELVADLSKKRLELYSFICQFDNGITSGEIINMNEYYRKSSISGRLSELDEMCLIKVIGDRVNKATNVLNSIYITCSPEEYELRRQGRIKQYTNRIVEIVNDKMNNELSKNTVKILNAELKRININLKNL